MPTCPCNDAGECPMQLIPDCAACDGFSTMGYMAAMAYRLEARVAALEQHEATIAKAILQLNDAVPLWERIEAIERRLEAGGPELAASQSLRTQQGDEDLSGAAATVPAAAQPAPQQPLPCALCGSCEEYHPTDNIQLVPKQQPRSCQTCKWENIKLTDDVDTPCDDCDTRYSYWQPREGVR